MGNVEFGGLGDLAKLAVSSGPFFFAVFVLVVGTQRARSYYYEVCSRKSPAPTPEEIHTYRAYFVYTWILGCVLVLGSVAWWIYTQTRLTYTYQVAITDVEPSTRIETDFYHRETYRARGVDNTMIQDYYVLIVQEKPFATGDKFTFSVYSLPAPVPTATALAPIAPNALGQSISPRKVDVVYQGKPQDRFRLEPDPAKGVKLVAVPPAESEGTASIAQAQGQRAVQGRVFASNNTRD